MLKTILKFLFPEHAENKLTAAILISQHGPDLFKRLTDSRALNAGAPPPDHVPTASTSNILTLSEIATAVGSGRFNPVETQVLKLIARHLKTCGHEIARSSNSSNGSAPYYGVSREELSSYSVRVMVEQGLLYCPPREIDEDAFALGI